MKNKNTLTLIFGAYYSHHHIYRICKKINKKYNIIVIENSLDENFKKKIEEKYKNTKVIIPQKNLGLAKSYNLGIQNARTKYVYLNCPDIDISNHSLKELIDCARKLGKFGILAPNYKNTSTYNNYIDEITLTKKQLPKIKKYKLKQVNFIDNSFLIETNKAKKFLFDEKYFLYFETMDFCFKLRKKNEKLFITDKIKFKHYEHKSVSSKYSDISKLTRAWHFNWSKFYYLRKNINYFYALRKIKNNMIGAVKKFVVNIFKFNLKESYLNLIEIYGIISSLFLLNSFYRPKK